MIAVNLIPDSRRVGRRSTSRMKAWVAFNLVWMIALVVVGLMFGSSSSNPHDVALEERLRLAKERLEGAQARDRAALAAFQSAQLAVHTARRAADRPDWSLLLALLEEHRGNDIMIESIDVAGGMIEEEPRPDAKPSRPTKPGAAKKKVERYTVVLTGVAASPGAASALVLRLEQTGLFAKLQLGETRPRDVEGIARTAFRIDCTLREKTAPITDADSASARARPPFGAMRTDADAGPALEKP
ncbi:MAG: PilN domain-containing protein [Phycisphaerales bacterium]